MRKLISIAALIAAMLSSVDAIAAIKVVTSTQDLESIVKEVGGDKVTVESLAKGYQDPHFVEAKPSFIFKLHSADLLVAVGRELEIGWLPPLITQSRNSKIQPGNRGFLDASLKARILDIPTGPITRAMGDVHPQGNPHYWLDPGNGRRIARAIAAKLSALDPSGAAEYRANLASFESKLTEGERRWDAMLGPFAGTEVVTYHNSWPNFLKRFRLKAAGYIEPKPGIPPSPGHVVQLVNLMRARRIPVILMEPYFDERTPKSIAQKTGAKLLTFIPSAGGVPSAKDYVALFDYDVKLLADALRSRPR
jgi:zinc/manganese transport system substrate-binding protein